MIKATVHKLYKNPRADEHLSLAIPLKKGELTDLSMLSVWDGDTQLKSQSKITAKYSDGSIRFAFLRFMGDLPGNAEKEFEIYTDRAAMVIDGINLEESADGYSIDTGAVRFCVKDYSSSVIDSLDYNGRHYCSEDFCGPVLTDGLKQKYDMQLNKWSIAECGPLCTILKATGENIYGGDGCEEGIHVAFELKLTAWLDKPWIEVSYRLINTTLSDLKVDSLNFSLRMKDGIPDYTLKDMDSDKLDSTGCGDMNYDLIPDAPVHHTMGTSDLSELEKLTPVSDIRTVAGISNYRTDFLIAAGGKDVCKIATASKLIREGNEHMIETFYGTLMCDRTDDISGVCATVYQAQQNYPKAVKADATHVHVMLVPENIDSVVMPSGVSREQKFLLHFHASDTPIVDYEDRSLIYQMPDLPVLSPLVYRESGAMQDVFSDSYHEAFECSLIATADGHSRSYGMLNFGDTIDANYTDQGRGGGAPVWINNEYDYPHACALMFIRSGTRRFLDYCICHSRHWMDVDVCHYSDNPLRIGGQIEHTSGHVRDGILVPSHQWCEGLLDYYHFTGDERGLETAIGIGKNVLKLLELPAYQNTGEANARETGWALRLFTALYYETNDESWLEKSQWIVGHFKEWQAEYGCWAAQYTDNTLVRTGFMISVAIGSLMKYYRLFPSQDLKELIINAVEDIYSNCRLDNGLFYYKELPSLARNGNNNLLLEAMATGYELTGDEKYLLAGKRTLIAYIQNAGNAKVTGKKTIKGDALVTGGGSTKTFAQCFYPLAYYHQQLCKAGLDGFLENY